MSTYKTGLDATVYSLVSSTYLEELLQLQIMIDADTVKAEGAADRYKLWQIVKQGHKATFRHKMAGATGENALCNLDLTALTLGGVSYLNTFRNGTIKATTIVKDVQIATNGYRTPIPVGTDIVFEGDFDLTSTADLVTQLINGTVAGGSFNVAVALTYGTESFAMPGLLAAASHGYGHEDLQTQKVTLKLRGTPTAPLAVATSLLGELILGTSVVAIDADTGANTYASANALIEELTISVQDSQLIEQSGTFAIQGSFTVS